MVTLVMFGGLFLFMYFLIIRPQRKRQKEHTDLVSALAKGDEVVMTSGMLGKVTKSALVDDDMPMPLQKGLTSFYASVWNQYASGVEDEIFDGSMRRLEREDEAKLYNLFGPVLREHMGWEVSNMLGKEDQPGGDKMMNGGMGQDLEIRAVNMIWRRGRGGGSI